MGSVLKSGFFSFPNTGNPKSKEKSDMQDVSTIFAVSQVDFTADLLVFPRQSCRCGPASRLSGIQEGCECEHWLCQVWGISAGPVTSLSLQGNLLLPRSGSTCWRCSPSYKASNPSPYPFHIDPVSLQPCLLFLQCFPPIITVRKAL